MGERLDWERDGRDWPHREASRFVRVGAQRWHVQVLGQGPVALLVHGTAASTHSWRGLADLLARDFTLVMPDLPGHGFSDAPPRDGYTLPAMARALGALTADLGLPPAMALGHSAGAAILARMALDGHAAPTALISLNGAFLPFGGPVGQFFLPIARALTLWPAVPRMFAWRANDRAVVARLIAGTGSHLDRTGVDLYARLMSSAGHCAAALSMMANWDLDTLQRDLHKLPVPLTLVAATNDRAIPPTQARRVARMAPHARVVTLPGLGHLAHEEDPAAVAELVRATLASASAEAR